MQNKEIEEDIKEMNIIITSIRKILGKDVKTTDEEVYTLDGRQYLAIENLLQYIDQLENKVKELGKGQHTLMQSRRKWKNKYYKERRIEIDENREDEKRISDKEYNLIKAIREYMKEED